MPQLLGPRQLGSQQVQLPPELPQFLARMLRLGPVRPALQLPRPGPVPRRGPVGLQLPVALFGLVCLRLGRLQRAQQVPFPHPRQLQVAFRRAQSVAQFLDLVPRGVAHLQRRHPQPVDVLLHLRGDGLPGGLGDLPQQLVHEVLGGDPRPAEVPRDAALVAVAAGRVAGERDPQRLEQLLQEGRERRDFRPPAPRFERHRPDSPPRPLPESGNPLRLAQPSTCVED
ncbi:hypothetical protein AMK19_22625 [Kitasatospora sp. CB01950]|nr:hypothetical protein AMK19_22625 [Kitasatospora sp. CB01950]